jgi:hypothetical protein
MPISYLMIDRADYEGANLPASMTIIIRPPGSGSTGPRNVKLR